MFTALFYILSSVCQYLTLYLLFVLCHYVHCCLLPSVYSLSGPDTEPSVVSLSLCPLLFSPVCPLPVRTANSTFGWFCHFYYRYLVSVHCLSVPHTTTVLVLYHSIHRSLLQSVHCFSLHHTVPSVFLCHYVNRYLLQSLHSLSAHHTVPSVDFVSLCLLMSSIICPLSVIT